jgi:hypothetical protein
MRSIVVLALLVGAAIAGVTGTAFGSTHATRRPARRSDSTPRDFDVAVDNSLTVGAGEQFGWSPAFSNCADAALGGSCAAVTGATSLVWSTSLPAGVTVLHAGWPGNPGLLDNCLLNCA